LIEISQCDVAVRIMVCLRHVSN